MQLEVAQSLRGIAEDLQRKARQLRPLAFPKRDSVVARITIMLEERRGSPSCFAARFGFLIRPECDNTLQAAMWSTVYDLFGAEKEENQEEEEEDEHEQYNGNPIGSAYEGAGTPKYEY